MILSLTNRCILFLHEHLDSSNIFSVLKHSKLIENKSVWRSCWKFTDKEAKDVLESSEFFEMDRSDLIELVKRNTMNIEEIELFTAINKWAANQYKKLRLDATMECSQILGDDIIDNLRFPVMEENKFNVVKSTNPTLLCPVNLFTLCYCRFQRNLSREEKFLSRVLRMPPVSDGPQE